MQDRKNLTLVTGLWVIVGVTQSLASVDVHEQISEEKKKRAGFVMGGEVANKLQERMKELNESLSKTVEENESTCHMDFDGQKDGLSPQKESSLEYPSQWVRRTENAPLRDTTLPPVLKPNLHAPIPQGFSPEVYLFFNKDVAQKYRVGTLSKTDAAIDHYKKYGHKEKRHYDVPIPSDFVASVYYQLNDDVLQAVLTSNDALDFAAQHHYRHYGYFEGRPYKY